MTPVYLTGIDLAEFRSFACLRVALAAEPGVMIVHGSNGLGKSSLFDALEWALTGDIDHFRSATGYKNIGKYLRRWGASVGPTSAALTFSDGGRVERQIASARAKDSSLSGSVEDIIAFLRASEWTPPITALDRYLMLTHFLGQSTLSRLTHRPADERFAVLKEASQSAELETFGIALHGSGSNATARAFNKRIEQLYREAADLRSLLDEEDTLWQASQQAGALDDAQSSDLAQTILSVLGRAWHHLVADGTSSSISAGGDPTVLQREIEHTQERARQRDLELNRSRTLCDQRERSIATRAEAAAAALEAEKAVSLATAATTEAKDEAAERHTRLNAALDALSRARRNHATLVELQQSLAALADTGSRLAAATEARSSARENLAKSEQQLQGIERRVQLISRLADEISDIEQQLAASRETIGRARRWLDCDQSIAAKRSELRELESAHPGIDEVVAAAERQVEEARVIADRHAAELAKAKASFDVLANAVTAIAGHLPHDLCECPVCATKFGDARALSERAAAAAGRLAPLLAEKQDAARRAQLQRDNAVASLRQSEGTRAQARALKSQIEVELVHNRELLDDLGWQEPHTPQAITARLDELDRGLGALSQRQARWHRWVARLAPDRGRLARERRDALRQRDDARRNDNATSRRLEDLSGEQEAGSRAFDARATPLFPGIEGIGASEIEAALVQAGDALEQAQETHDQALTEATEQDARVASLQLTEASLKASLAQWTERRNAAETSLAAQSAQWHSLGWTEGGPTGAELDAAVQELVIARDAIAEAEESLKRLRDGREAWTRQLAHRRALDRLCSTLDLAPNIGRDRATTVGHDRIQQTIQKTSATRSAKEIASLTSADIAREVEEFNAEYIEPLGKLTKQINQAILCDPRIGIDLHVKRKKIEQSASRIGELPANLGPIDPILVHSEGQMAALAVSMLCAASLTYPWSRWRALVLDDPLQHNDAIHASAFADLMGNLVTARQYQILLSTHDLAQSEFLQRKFDARRIPCAVLNLLGRGKGGVEWNFRESKAASKPSAASA